MSYAQFLQPQPSAFTLWTRKLHRWIGIVFLLTVALNFAWRPFAPAPMWLTYLPLPFLFAMMISGIFMLVKHYRDKARKA